MDKTAHSTAFKPSLYRSCALTEPPDEPFDSAYPLVFGQFTSHRPCPPGRPLVVHQRDAHDEDEQIRPDGSPETSDAPTCNPKELSLGDAPDAAADEECQVRIRVELVFERIVDNGVIKCGHREDREDVNRAREVAERSGEQEEYIL